MRYRVTAAGATYEIAIEERSGARIVTVNGRPADADLAPLAEGRRFSLIIDRKSWDVAVTCEPDRCRVTLAGQTFDCVVDDGTLAAARGGPAWAATHDRELMTPMPGLVVAIRVKPGDRVRKGDGLVIVEAMKMENELKAPHDGIVSDVYARPGEVVAKGQVLLAFE